MIQRLASESKIYLALDCTAQYLTVQDLMKITKIARKSHGMIHISYGSWLVLVGVSENYSRKVVEGLRKIGHECGVFSGKMNERSTFALS